MIKILLLSLGLAFSAVGFAHAAFVVPLNKGGSYGPTYSAQKNSPNKPACRAGEHRDLQTNNCETDSYD